MARTQAVDYEERKEIILDKAAALFAKHGFLGTSVMDIAQACNASKSLLYHYYPSKEDVLYAVMASHIDRLLEDVDEVMDLQATAESRLRTLLTYFLRDYIGAADRQKVLLNELENLPEDRRRAIVAKQRKIVDAIQGLLATLLPAELSDPVKARAKTMLLFGMINWTSNWFKPSGQLGPDDIAEMAYGMVIGSREDHRPAH